MNKEMTLLAVAGKCGFRGAIGLTPAPCARSIMSSAASHPMPSPDDCRNLRRDSLVRINKLAHVEQQQTEARQRIALQVIERRCLLFRRRIPPESEPPSRFDGFL